MNDEDDLTIQASEDTIRRLLGKSSATVTGDSATADATLDGDTDTQATEHVEENDDRTRPGDPDHQPRLTDEPGVDLDFTESNDPTVMGAPASPGEATPGTSGDETIEPKPSRTSLVWEPVPSDEAAHVAPPPTTRPGVPEALAESSGSTESTVHDGQAPPAILPAAAAAVPTSPPVEPPPPPSASPPPPAGSAPYAPVPPPAPVTGVDADLAQLAAGPSSPQLGTPAADTFFDREPFVPERRIAPILLAIAGIPLVLLLLAIIWYLMSR